MTTCCAPACSQALPVKPQGVWARGIEAWAWSRDHRNMEFLRWGSSGPSSLMPEQLPLLALKSIHRGWSAATARWGQGQLLRLGVSEACDLADGSPECYLGVWQSERPFLCGMKLFIHDLTSTAVLRSTMRLGNGWVFTAYCLCGYDYLSMP